MSLGRAFQFGLVNAATACAPQYPFLPVAGSPRNIEHMLGDRLGRIWIRTPDDVLCFDGSRFYSLKKAGLPPQGAWALAEDGAGGIVIGSIQGVYRYSDGRVEQLTDKVEVSESCQYRSECPTSFRQAEARQAVALSLSDPACRGNLANRRIPWNTRRALELGPFRIDLDTMPK